MLWAVGQAWEGPTVLDRSLVILDFETTGFGPDDRVIEIAALRLDGRRERELHRLCNPGRPLPPRITEITGLTDTDLGAAPPTSAAIRELYGQMLQDEPVLVAHNVIFDRRFLNQELARIGLPPFGGDVVCTMSLSFQLYPRLSSHRLPDLARHLRIPVQRSHRALDDVRATRRLLELLLAAARRAGIEPLNNLARWAQ